MVYCGITQQRVDGCDQQWQSGQFAGRPKKGSRRRCRCSWCLSWRVIVKRAHYVDWQRRRSTTKGKAGCDRALVGAWNNDVKNNIPKILGFGTV
jgi:hypothetical protein